MSQFEKYQMLVAIWDKETAIIKLKGFILNDETLSVFRQNDWRNLLHLLIKHYN